MVWRVNDSADPELPGRDRAGRCGGPRRRHDAHDRQQRHDPADDRPAPALRRQRGLRARFSDVCPDYWAYTFIEFLAQQGIVSGYADGTFRPNSTATRAQLAKMIVVARGWPVVTPPTPSFSDVPASNPFYGYIETAKAHGVICGYADGTLPPEQQGDPRPDQQNDRDRLWLGHQHQRAGRTSPTCRPATPSIPSSKPPSTTR